MTVVNPKSISGINSITMASGSDDLLTIHSNNTTERVRVNNSGDVIVGSGVTLSPDGDVFATGVCTATSFSGDGSALTGIDLGAVTGATGDFSIADKIVHTGDTNTTIRFPAADTVSVETGGSERARINSDGQLLVGTTETSPYANRTLMTNKNGGNYVSVTTDSSNDCGIVFGDGTANNTANYESYMAHSNSTNDFTIYVNQGSNSRYLRLKSATGHVELGSGNLVLASGAGIDFSATDNGGTGTPSELLDDYEEGTWTPAFAGGTGSISVAGYSLQAGKYTKIGNYVYVEGQLRGQVTNNSTGTYDISGLPYTVDANGSGGVLVCFDQASWIRAPHQFVPVVGTTVARAREGIDRGETGYTNGASDAFNASNTNCNRVYFAGSYRIA